MSGAFKEDVVDVLMVKFGGSNFWIMLGHVYFTGNSQRSL